MAESTAPPGNIWLDRKLGGERVWGDTNDGRVAFDPGSGTPDYDNDTQALTWAALERLPMEAGSSQQQMDVSKLSRVERANMVEKAFATSEQDNESLLLRLKSRIDKVGIKLPTVEVRFEDLYVDAYVHVGSRALPTLWNFVRNLLEGLLSACKIFPNRKRDFRILHGVSGVIKPGRMTLLLGPPGAGKSTLLLSLAGKLDSTLRHTGLVTYNGHRLHEFVPQRTASYISQTDNHIGELTVRETLDFAARCQGVGYKHEMMLELARREKRLNILPDPEIDAFMKAVASEEKSLSTEYTLKVYGLDICADTLVGSEMLRGISGGQKKRVTTGEMVVGPKQTLFMDEISTGLDSSTTFQIVKCTRNFTHTLDATVLMALLQPAPETFDLFDDILLLAEGHIVYLGPRDKVLEFFDSLGFKLPPRKGVADFLQEITSRKDQGQYWRDKSRPYSFMTVSTMANAFKESELGKALNVYLASPYDRSQSHSKALAKTRYGLTNMKVLKACFEREVLLIKRNAFLYIFRTCQVAFMAMVTATLFLHTRLHPDSESDGNLYMAALFFALIHMMFNGFSELPITVFRLPVYYKQRDNLFYPGWAFSIPGWILRLPYSAVESIIWSVIAYYSIGLAPEAGRFFRYMLILFLIHQMALGLFRTIAAVGRSIVIASTFGSFGLLAVFVLGGFIISKNSIHPWWIWGYWVSPLSYSQNAIAVNEFLAPRWNKPSPFTGQILFKNILTARGLPTRGFWFWIGVGVLAGYTFLLNFLVTMALTFFDPLGKPQAIVTEALLKSRREDIGGSGSSVRPERMEDQKQKQQVPHIHVDLRHLGASNAAKGMVLPFQPLALTFHNVSYYVDMPTEMKKEGVSSDKLQLLCNVSGAFRPGVLTALMGVSGAGKTTLMDVLAGRKTGGYIEGDIRVSGFPKVQKTFARISGYVEQNDIHSPQVTVHESLLFSSWLRLPDSVDTGTRHAFVREIMDLVELASLKDALVGLPGSTGLSTEQRKRLTIAVELVANPSIIFMDEPTSGLDARAAAIVMRTVRNTVDTGRTVVCTIHQPSIDIFESFDELLLLKRGGQTIYNGPLGERSKQLIEYFQGINGIPPVKDGHNPAAWMLDVTTVGSEQRLKIDFAEVLKTSDLFRQNEQVIEQLSKQATGSLDLIFPTEFSRNSITQFLACLWKQNLTYWRSPHYNAVRFFFTTICAIILGTIFWGLGTKRTTEQNVFNVMGVLYASVLFLGVNNATSVQPVVAIERTVFYRERAAGMYSAIPYAFAQELIEIPYIITQTFIYSLLTYSMIQFEWTAAKFFWYSLFMFLTFTYFTFYGMMAVGLTPSQQLSAVISSMFFSIWNLFSGFLIPKPRMPPWASWYYWLSPVAWTLYGLVSSQLGDVNTKIVNAPGQPTVAQFVESYLGFKHHMVGVCVAVIAGFIVLFWFVFAFSMKYLNFQRR